MHSQKEQTADQDELFGSLSDGFEALLRKVEDLASKNADLRREVEELRSQVGYSGILWQRSVMKKQPSSRSGAASGDDRTFNHKI